MLREIVKPFNRRNQRKPASRGFVHVILLVLVLLGATTYGVVIFQAKIQERKAQRAQVTPKVLDEAKRGLLAFAQGDGIESRMVVAGRLPPLDYYNVAVPYDHQDDFFIASRPGQLPCPDNVGDPILNSLDLGSIPNSAPSPLRSASDGNLDGVADYGSIRSNLGGITILSNNCSSDIISRAQRALVDESLVGRFPWNEYYDYVSLVRGVGTGDLIDGNGDRLWYSVSPNLTDQSRPLNRYKVTRQQDGWLTVRVFPTEPANAFTAAVNLPITLPGVGDAAAVVISPGIPNNTQRPSRIRESEIYGPTSVLSTLEASQVGNYLEGENADDDFNFDHRLGEIPDSYDTLTYINRDDILTAMASAEELAGDKHIDAIADALSAYYERNSHLPDPTSFDVASSEYINQRFGRPAAPPSNELFSVYTNLRPTSSTKYQLDGIIMQGGRVESESVALTENSAGVSEIIQYNNLLPLGKLPFSQMPPIMPGLPANVVLADALAPVPNAFGIPPFPPFSNFLSPFSEPSSPALGQTNLAAVIPAFTPVRAARAFFTNPIQGNITPSSHLTVYTDPLGNHTIANSIGSAFTVGSGSYTGAGVISYPQGPFNVRLADGHPETLFNLTRFGYGVKMPAGTWLMATVAMTIIGHPGVQQVYPTGDLVSGGLFAYRPIMDPSDIYYGTYRNDSGVPLPNGITDQPISIPAKTPLAAASQGLLPVELLPNQLRGTADATVAYREHGLLGNAKLITPVVDSSRDPMVAVVTDPNGAYGYFPAEVTMHPLREDATNQLTGTGPGNVPRQIRIDRDVDRFTDNHVTARPTPIAAGDSGVLPAVIQVGGPITFPVGSKFYYPVGTKIPLGHRTFNHGHNTYNFAPSPVIPSPFGVSSSGATVWARVQLAPGAVLHDVTVDSVGDILPDGTQAAATSLAAVTLVNGGELRYDQLLHYTDGDVAMVPQTAAQRAFRVESMGLALTEYDSDTSSYPITAGLTLFEADVVDADTDRFGYYLYPYHASYERRSQPIPPFYRPLVTPGGAIDSYNVATRGRIDFSRAPLENLVARADLWLYNVGAGAAPAIAFTSQRTPAGRNATPSSFNLVDGHGVAFTALTTTVGAMVDGAGTMLPAILNLTLFVDRGVRLQSNPSRIQLLQPLDPAYVSPEVAMLGFAQYGDPRDTTPLVLPTAPDEMLEVLEAIEIDYDGAAAAFTPQIVDARSSELALHFPQYSFDGGVNNIQSAIHAYDFNAITITAGMASDVLDLGDSLENSRRAIFHLNADAILPIIDQVNDIQAGPLSGMLPSGSYAEFGWLESFSHNSVDAPGITTYFAPGGRIFSGLGFYPTPVAAAVRPNRDLISFDGPISITLLVTVTTRAAVPPVPAIPPSLGNPGVPGVPGMPAVTEQGIAELTNPRMLLPGGFDIDNWDVLSGVANCGNNAFTECVALDEDIRFAASSITINYPTAADVASGPTVLDAPAGFIGANDVNDLAGLQFQFATHGGGFLTAPVTVGAGVQTVTMTVAGVVTETTTPFAGIEQTQRLEPIQDSQVMRWRIAPHLSTGAAVAAPALHGLTELSWSGKDGRFGFGELEPSAQVFAQNQYIHYAVEEQCRRDISLRPDIDCTTEPEAGLEVNVPPGENVRFPEDAISPAGILFHAYRPLVAAVDTQSFFTLRHTDAGGVAATVTVAAARLSSDGRLEVLEPHPTNPNEVTNPSILSAMLGTTISLVPGNQGVLLQYEPNASSSYELNVPNDRSIRSGHTRQFEIIAGGFTDNNLDAAAYRVTLVANTPFTIAGGSTLDINNIDTFSLFLGEGSSDGTNDLGGLHTVTPSTDINIVLGANALQTQDGIDLPVGLPAGGTIAVMSNINLIAQPLIVNGTQIIIPASNRVVQGIVAGAATQAQINRTGGAGLLYARTHRTESNPGATGIPTGYQEGDAGLSRLDSIDYSRAYSGAFPLLDPATGLAQIVNPVTFPYVAINVDCLACQEDTVIDISQLATNTVAAAGVTTYAYPDDLTLTVSLNVHSTGLNAGVNTEIMADIEYVVNFSTFATISLSPVVLHRHNAASLTLLFTSVADPDVTVLPGGINMNGTMIESRVVSDGRTNYADNFYHTSINLGLNVLTLNNLHDNTAFAIGLFNQPLSININAAAPNFTIPGDRPMAIFFRPQTPTLGVFDAAGGVYGNALAVTAGADHPDVGQYAQLFSDGRYQATFTGADEVAIQIPMDLAGDVPLNDGTMINLFAGSMIYPLSGRVLAAQQFNFVATPPPPAVPLPPQPISIQLGNNGAAGQLVGGGGVGRPILHQRRRLSRVTRDLGDDGRSYFSVLSGADINLLVPLVDVTATTPIVVTPFVSNSSGTVDIHVLDPLVDATNAGLDSLDTRYGNIFGDAGQDRTPVINTFFDSSTFSPDTAPTAFSAPETHVIDFLPNSDLIIYPPGYAAAPKVVTTPHVARYRRVDGGDADIDGSLVIRETLLPGNQFTFADGTIIDLLTAHAGIVDIGNTLLPNATNDTALLTAPLDQNLWVRIHDPVVVNGVIDPDTGAPPLTLPANTVINPFLGTYLLPPQINVPAHDREIAFNGSNAATATRDLVFSTPALMLQAGVTINSGQVTMTFTDTKAVIMHSPAPLHDAEIDCLTYTFFFANDDPVAFHVNGNRLINQRTNGTSLAPGSINNIYYSQYSGGGFSATPYGNPVGHGHPCQVLDIHENFDGDRIYTYTSGMLATPDDPSSREFEAPIQRVNDRMRMIGGKLRP